ncbi:hypothetical protein G6F56_004798 [Rhizopus delemar]|nr:hypothetical protein G6F56_004798 [Rhizopus delemar]
MTTEPTLKSSPSSTNIYSRFELCRPERTDTIDALAQFASSDITGLELTPSAAIRDRYYQSTRNLHHDNGKEEEEEEEEEGEGDEKVEVEEEISGDILDYRPGEGEVCAKPESIYMFVR